jgi:predicted dehydrogenase/flavin reductase (DIM6/NTAB) family NADH-FMN oxidoreductase RutF
MRWPGRTIWDTRIQSVCGILTVSSEEGTEIFGSASFAQASLNPARVIINPNRTYAFEPAVRQTARFAINVLPATSRNLMIQWMRIRRREAEKIRILGLTIVTDDQFGVPFIKGSLRTIFCEVEDIYESGDRRLYLAKVLESRVNPAFNGGLPLLFAQVTDDSEIPRLRYAIRTTLVLSGLLDLSKTVLHKFRAPAPANISKTTYLEAGATEQEIATILAPGITDRGRYLKPPPSPAVLTKRVGVCVVGTGWGQTHCHYLRRVSSKVRLFLCGRNKEKTERIARVVGAEAYFLDLDQALSDSRVDAVTLALPHDMHRNALEAAARAGKHALVEKPIATNLPDADAMISAANKAGTILMVAEDMHFRPAIREAVRLIENGAIGEPLYLLAHAAGVRRPSGWAAEKERLGGGVLMDIGVHYVRALRLLMGEPHDVFASKSMQINTKMTGEDSAQLLFSSRYGWQAHMLLSWSSQRGHLPDIVVEGEKGTIYLWPGAGFIDYYPVKPKTVTRLLSYVRPYSLQAKLMKPGLQRIRIRLKEKDFTGYLGEMSEFVSAVAEGRAPVTLAEDGRRDLEIITYGYRALSEGNRVQIKELEPG